MMDAHPVSEIFPVMGEEEFAQLKADIERYGQHEPILIYHGKILDGRNRYRACLEIGIPPRTREWSGEGSMVACVVSHNLHRRHLDKSVLAACAVRAEELERLEQEAKERQREAGGDRKSEQARASGSVEAIVPQPIERDPQSRDTIAAMFGTSPRYVQDAKKLKEKAPDLLERVLAASITIPQAIRALKRRKQGESRNGTPAGAKADGAETVTTPTTATATTGPGKRSGVLVIGLSSADPPDIWAEEILRLGSRSKIRKLVALLNHQLDPSTT